jgi:hypothetical protein
MDPSEVLAQEKPTVTERKGTASAPEAARWLNHPTPPAQRLTLAQRLAAEPEWEDPESGKP